MSCYKVWSHSEKLLMFRLPHLLRKHVSTGAMEPTEAPQEVGVEPTVKERLQSMLERIVLQSQVQRGDGELLVQV
ncbi:hypothetical protein [Oryza sativa Japonica Group]|uniref:Uncharacterized protein n=1 Tax=Oryza sativa subsp. japonica TaxID=39947 RepID=Q5QN19_ORYSJ|nr:hypothetical protein [Oryza sativa Japonica Group]